MIMQIAISNKQSSSNNHDIQHMHNIFSKYSSRGVYSGVYIQCLTSTKQFKTVGNTIWVENSIYKAKQKSGRKLLQQKRSFPSDQNSSEFFCNFSTGSTYNFALEPKI
jgi:hypothetical protein